MHHGETNRAETLGAALTIHNISMTIINRFRHLAAAALLLAAPQLRAALPYADGDLILGFRATGGQGGTTSYAVNIGSAAQFVSAASFTVDLGGNIAADLENIYGADWKTRSDVFWSISGAQFTAANGFSNRTIFASKAEATAGTQSTPWTRVTLSTQNPVALRVQALGDPGYIAGTTATTPGQTQSTNTTKGLIQDNGAPNSYASHMPGGSNSSVGSAFQFFINGALGIENTFENGTNGSVIDLYQLTPGSAGSPATLLGAFRLSDSGVLTYSPNPADFGSGPAPAQVALSSATYSVQEDGGNAVITINRTVNTSTAFSVNLSTTDGTATSASDYTAQSSVAVSFAATETTKTVNIPIVDRAGFQGNRAFNVSIALGSGTATVIAPNSATVTIVENDPQPATIALSSATFDVTENAGNAVVTVTRSGSTTGAASVDFNSSGNTALPVTDFTVISTTVNFVDGETTKTVNIPIVDRVGFQGNRFFTVGLSNAAGAALGATTSAQVTIQENEVAPSFALTSSSINVSETATSVDVVVVRSGDTDTVASIFHETTVGTAVESRDFNPGDGTIVFGVGETTKTVTVGLFDAPGFQGSRTFNVVFGTPSVGSFSGPSTAVVTITDNDAQPGGAVAGNYAGLLKSVPAPTLNNIGAVALKITPTGSFTGKVFIGGTTLPIAGTFGANGVATFKNAGTTIALALKTKPAPTALGDFAMTIFADSIGGTLTNGASVSNLAAERVVPYDGKTPQTTVPATILDAVTKGYHTGVIPSKAQGTLTNDKFPQGDGIFSFAVSKKGAFKAAGTLADGTKFSAASALNKLNSAPLFAQLYKRKAGLLAAELKFDSSRADSDALALNTLWMRPVDLGAKHYPDGWPAGITLDMLAARYRAPQKGDVTSAFPGLGADDLVAGNATLTAADGKLTAAVVNNVNISAKNKVTNAPATDKDFKLTFGAPKGTLGGFFTHTDGTKPKFVGIVFQKGPDKGGYGFFLSTKPKTGPTGESGGVSVLAK
ncbi:MAG: hypothetical protein RL088_3559 [Verrucomicrobiota bacterium]